MAKAEKSAAEGMDEGFTTKRMSVDWKYVLFYGFFYFCLILIALFGIISEV